MRLRCMQVILKLTKKWKMLLLILSATILSTTILLHSSITARRPKTLLIHNNKYLCSSNRPPVNSHNQLSKLFSSSETTGISMVIIIPSCQKNFGRRNVIRQTYGSIKNINNVNILAVVFMLGSDNDLDLNLVSKLEAERIQFEDVVVGDFVDTYRNLTLKSIMAYNWLTSFCQDADIVLKTDDDVMVDIFKLTEQLGKWSPTVFRSFNFWCAVHYRDITDRDQNSIYYVSPEEYSGSIMPKHCAGVGYLTTMGTIQKISNEISKSFLGSVCTQEDVFMTGIVPEKINSVGKESIKHIDKMIDWVLYIGKNDNVRGGQHIFNLIQRPANESVDFEEFRNRSGTRVFYLIEQGPDFEKLFMRLWYLVKNAALRNPDNNNN